MMAFYYFPAKGERRGGGGAGGEMLRWTWCVQRAGLSSQYTQRISRGWRRGEDVIVATLVKEGSVLKLHPASLEILRRNSAGGGGPKARSATGCAFFCSLLL